jgi:hypothetical protein
MSHRRIVLKSSCNVGQDESSYNSVSSLAVK